MKRLVFLAFILMAFSNGNPAYRLFKENGKPIKYQKMVKQIADADIVLFGELHNNPISHWLELQLTKDLHALKGEKLILGAEMFEADNQEFVSKYLRGEMDEESFMDTTRLWPNYKTDYKPLVDFAKENQLNFVASNIPRRYASKVFKGGFEALEELSTEEKTWLAPLPVKYDAELPGYKAMKKMGMHMSSKKLDNFPKAQAIKDATMAHFILENWERGQQFLHYNGAYHSDNYEGIVWYLKQAKPDLKIVTIYTATAEKIRKINPELKGKNSYYIVVRDDMTKTY
ncbi:ChaN family lipoprotein [Marinifilum caeruleilacunae]|uniref:Iron-regulated protein n=1 Tax=Marinifilum caeruleilacunae TaxID=2499076 RepID=A0ABX1WVX4_9BACT|nr:ChaN family lipoprotein [Marinifilum caeruleilacunae]NOU60249.1 iron-regulated protein [Marinifilum caeruleilacunae]